MPTLIRLIIVLLFLAGLVYGGMVALVAMVDPEPRPVTVRIPARDLFEEQPGPPALLPGRTAPAEDAAAEPSP